MSNDKEKPTIRELEEMLRHASEPAMVWTLKHMIVRAKMTPEQIEAADKKAAIWREEWAKREAALTPIPYTEPRQLSCNLHRDWCDC